MIPRLRFGLLLTTAAGILALAPAAWWITLAALPDEAFSPVDPDHMFGPIDLDPAVKAAIGWVSIVVTVLSLTILVGSIRRGDTSARWWRVVAPLAAIAVYAGFTYRVVTAPVVGANIGGGMLLLAAPLVVIALLATAAFQLSRLPGLARGDAAASPDGLGGHLG